MDKEELFSEFHRILKEQGQGKNCFEVLNEDKTCCIFYIETTEPNQTITSVSEALNNSVNRAKIDKAIAELRKEIEENHLNVIDYADGEWIVKDFVYGAIERFKRNIGE